MKWSLKACQFSFQPACLPTVLFVAVVFVLNGLVVSVVALKALKLSLVLELGSEII